MNVSQLALSDASRKLAGLLVQVERPLLELDRALVLALDHRDLAQPGKRVGVVAFLKRTLETGLRRLPVRGGDRPLTPAQQVFPRLDTHRRRSSHPDHRSASEPDTLGQWPRGTCATASRASNDSRSDRRKCRFALGAVVSHPRPMRRPLGTRSGSSAGCLPVPVGSLRGHAGSSGSCATALKNHTGLCREIPGTGRQLNRSHIRALGPLWNGELRTLPSKASIEVPA